MAGKKSIEKEIEDMLRDAFEHARRPSVTLDEKLDVLKVAIMWKKSQKGVDDDPEGSFFDEGNKDSNLGESLRKPK